MLALGRTHILPLFPAPMKRNQFMMLTAFVAWLFGLVMMMAPDKMLGGLGVAPGDIPNYLLQLIGVHLFATGWINFLARNDTGSALRGVMIANILLHVLSFAFDFIGYGKGLIVVTGVVMGAIVHIGLIAGFAYYLIKWPKQSAA